VGFSFAVHLLGRAGQHLADETAPEKAGGIIRLNLEPYSFGPDFAAASVAANRTPIHHMRPAHGI
jgi:hypothetical protein